MREANFEYCINYYWYKHLYMFYSTFIDTNANIFVKPKSSVFKCTKERKNPVNHQRKSK